MDSPNIVWSRVPKVVLHEHLDGNLRPQTLVELCRERDIALPAHTPQDLQLWIHEQANSGSLERYVAAFALTVAAMATPEACERVAYEAVVDCVADGALLVELRMAPLLLAPLGLAGDEAVQAMVRGMARASLETGVACGLIVCGMRSDSPDQVMRSAELAARHVGRGVIGFDLAGAEKSYPARAHGQAIALAREAGLGLTLHAGESDVGERVIEAIELGASRIGHGVWITRGDGAQARMARAREAGVHFEVCPTSNVHTGASADLRSHPLLVMEAEGLNWSVQADNRLISVLTQGSEMQAVHEHCGLDLKALLQGQMRAARASFLPASNKQQALAALERWSADHSLLFS